jgi:hypothetical protein
VSRGKMTRGMRREAGQLSRGESVPALKKLKKTGA